MIDIAKETPVSFNQVAKEAPRRRAGRKCHVSTVHRWATVGIRGHKLEFIQYGGTRVTSREALQRFFDRLTSGLAVVGTTSTTRTTAQRDRESQAALAACEAEGL